MLSGIASKRGQNCNQDVEYFREPSAKYLSAYALHLFSRTKDWSVKDMLEKAHFLRSRGQNNIKKNLQ